MSVYTKTGDKGETSLFDPTNSQSVRVSKSSLVVEAIGCVDELNSYLGVVKESSDDKKLSDRINEVQNDLFTIGSMLSGSLLTFGANKTKNLERQIDKMESVLPVLKTFILSGGTMVSAHLQYARSLARRAERRVFTLNKEREQKPEMLTYLNRLSDYLFTLARYNNFKYKVTETVWKK